MICSHCLLQVSKDLEARAAASAAALLAEEERAKAKAAAKKAKKQKQKAKKQQGPTAATAAAAAAPDTLSFSVMEADTTVPAAHDRTAPVHADGVSQAFATPANLQQQMQQHIEAPTKAANNFDDAFLTNLFCCPLTKVRLICCKNVAAGIDRHAASEHAHCSACQPRPMLIPQGCIAMSSAACGVLPVDLSQAASGADIHMTYKR